MDAVALVSVAVTGAVGLAGVSSAVWTSNKERQLRATEAAADREADAEKAAAAREHERKLARDARIWEDKRKSYVDLLQHLLVLMEGVEQTFPMVTVRRLGEEAEEEVRDEAPTGEQLTEQRARLTEMEAGITAFGSNEVVLLTQEFMQKSRMFSFDVGTYRTVKDQGAQGEQVRQAWERLQQTREELRDLYTRISDRMRTELQET